MSGLSARLREIIEERLRVARAMLGACAGSHGWCGDECEEFQQDNDPADAILAGERDLGVLERHTVVVRREYFTGKGTVDDPQCAWCELTSNDGDPLGRPWPCAEIVALATRYGVTE